MWEFSAVHLTELLQLPFPAASGHSTEGWSRSLDWSETASRSVLVNHQWTSTHQLLCLCHRGEWLNVCPSIKKSVWSQMNGRSQWARKAYCSQVRWESSRDRLTSPDVKEVNTNTVICLCTEVVTHFVSGWWCCTTGEPLETCTAQKYMSSDLGKMLTLVSSLFIYRYWKTYIYITKVM